MAPSIVCTSRKTELTDARNAVASAALMLIFRQPFSFFMAMLLRSYVFMLPIALMLSPYPVIFISAKYLNFLEDSSV